MARWQIHRLTRALGAHTEAWDALNARLFNTHPMLQSRFIDGLLKHFGTGSEHLCVFESNGRPDAMCILQRGRLGIWQTFLPSQAQIGPALMPGTDLLPDLMQSLPGLVTRLDFLCNDPEFGNLSKGNYATTTSQNHALTMCISLAGSFENYWAARSKNLTKNMGRYARRLVTDQLERKFLCITSPEAIGPAVARYAILESKGWKAKLGTSIDIDNAQGLFYTDLMTQFAASGNAMVFELWFGEHLAASRLVIASADMPIILKTTYDEAFDQYAPGRQLLKDVIQHLFNSHQGKVLEFYTDANADNLSWSTGQRWIKHVSVHSSALAENTFSLLRIARQAIRPDKKKPATTNNACSVSVYQHPDACPPDVKQLFEQGQRQNIEFGAAWYRNLINTVYPDQNGVGIYVLRKKEQPVAMLLVLAHKSARGQTVSSLSNYYSSMYAPLLDPGLKAPNLVPMLSAIKENHQPLRHLRFAPLDPESSNYCTLLEALQLAGFATFKHFSFGNWYHTVTEDWASYLKNRESKLQHVIKRMTRKFLAAKGTLELITGAPDLERGLAAYEHVYALSWKKPEPFPDFIPGLMRTCADQGWLRLGIAWLDGKAIAAQFWIVANGKASIYKLAYDEHFKAYAPGNLLTAMLMEHVIEKDKVTEVDYLIGDDPYKKTWMNHRRERWGIVAYNPATLSGLIGLGRETAGRAINALWAKFSGSKPLSAP